MKKNKFLSVTMAAVLALSPVMTATAGTVEEFTDDQMFGYGYWQEYDSANDQINTGDEILEGDFDITYTFHSGLTDDDCQKNFNITFWNDIGTRWTGNAKALSIAGDMTICPFYGQWTSYKDENGTVYEDGTFTQTQDPEVYGTDYENLLKNADITVHAVRKDDTITVTNQMKALNGTIYTWSGTAAADFGELLYINLDCAGINMTKINFTVNSGNHIDGNEVIRNDETGIPDAVLYQILLQQGDANGGNGSDGYGNSDGILTREEALHIKVLTVNSDGNYGSQYYPASYENLAKFCPNIENIQFDVQAAYSTDGTTETMTDIAGFMEQVKDFYHVKELYMYGPGAVITSDQLQNLGEDKLSELTSLNIWVDDTFDYSVLDSAVNVDNLMIYIDANTPVEVKTSEVFPKGMTKLYGAYIQNNTQGGTIHVDTVADDTGIMQLSLSAENLDLAGLNDMGISNLQLSANHWENVPNFNLFASSITELYLHTWQSDYSELFDFKIDFTKFQKLYRLNISNQDLSAIDFSKLSTSITDLSLYKCKLPDDMDVSKLTGLQYISIGESNLKKITGMSELKELGSVTFYETELTELPTFPLENIYNITARNNKISSIPDLSGAAGMITLDLSDNDLTIEALKGKVPTSFETNNSWMLDTTAKYIYNINNGSYYTKVYTALNSEYLMNQFEPGYSSSLYYTVHQPQLVIEDELVQYMKKNNKSVTLAYMDLDTGRTVETAYVRGDKIPEDYTGTITIDFTNIPENGMWEVNDELVKDSVIQETYLTYSIQDTSSAVDLYSYSDTTGYTLLQKRAAFYAVSNDYKNGEYEGQKVYVRSVYLNADEENRTYTEAQGKFSDAKYLNYQDALSLSNTNTVNQNTLKNMVENAATKSLLEIKCTDNMYIPAQVWNQIVDKQLNLQITFVTGYNDVTSVFNIKNEDMAEITDLDQWLSIWNSYSMGKDTVTAGFSTNMYTISSGMSFNYIGNAKDYIKAATAKYHVGYRIANGRKAGTQVYYFYMDKNYEGQAVKYQPADTYEVKSGYITVPITQTTDYNGDITINSNATYIDVTDLPTQINVDEAPLPNMNVGTATKGDVLAEGSNGLLSDAVLTGSKDEVTLYTKFTTDELDENSQSTLMQLYSRKDNGSYAQQMLELYTIGKNIYVSGDFGYLDINTPCLKENAENTVYFILKNSGEKMIDMTLYVNDTLVFEGKYKNGVYEKTQGLGFEASIYIFNPKNLSDYLTTINTMGVNRESMYESEISNKNITVNEAKIYAGAITPSDDISSNDEYNFTCAEYGKVGSTPFAVNGNFELEYAFDLQAYLHNERNNNFGIQITDGTETVDAVCDSNHCTDTAMSALKSAHVIVNVKREGNTITATGKVGKKTVFTYKKEDVKLNAASTVRITGEYCKVKNLTMEDLTKTLVSDSVGDTTVNEKPAVVEETKIVDNTKVESTVVSNMDNTIKKNIEVVTNNSTELTPEIVTAMKEKDKNVTIGVVDETNKLQYSWTFKGDDINTVSKPIDLSLTFATKKQQEVEAITGQKNTVYLSFGYHGELPGEATMRTYVGDKYKNGERIYLYYYNEETGKVEAAGGKALEVKEGYVEFSITHCSVYFLTDDIFNSIELALDSNYTLNTLKKLIKGVQTGTTVTELETNFENSALKVLDLEGNEVKTVSKVGTGFRIQQITNGNVVDEIAVVVTGDVSGDGIVNVMDMEAIQKSILSITEISTGAAVEAANVNEDDVINVMDMEAIQKHILGLEILE